MNISKIANNYIHQLGVKLNLTVNLRGLEYHIQKSNLELFHPFCQKNPTIVWTEDNHEDEIHYIKGFIEKKICSMEKM